MTRLELATILMQGLLANPKPGIKTKHAEPGDDITPEIVAKVAVECADALLIAVYTGREQQDE